MAFESMFGRKSQERKYGAGETRKVSKAEQEGKFTWEPTGQWLGYRLVSDMGNSFFESSFDGHTFEVIGPNGARTDDRPETWRQSAEHWYMESIRPAEKEFMRSVGDRIYDLPFPSTSLQALGREACDVAAVDGDTVIPIQDFLAVASRTPEDYAAKLQLVQAYQTYKDTGAEDVKVRFNDGTSVSVPMDHFMPRDQAIPTRPSWDYAPHQGMSPVEPESGRWHEFDGVSMENGEDLSEEEDTGMGL